MFTRVAFPASIVNRQRKQNPGTSERDGLIELFEAHVQ